MVLGLKGEKTACVKRRLASFNIVFTILKKNIVKRK
jgi:hypothetical protein